MAVLDGGRPKPLDTLAWEQIYSFAGRSKFKPAAFATIGLADIKDWNALTATLASAKVNRRRSPLDCRKVSWRE